MPRKRTNLTSVLNRQSKSDLVELIVAYAKYDSPFREYVQLRVDSSGKGRSATFAHFKKAIDELLGDENIDQFLRRDQEQRFDRLVESIGALNETGRSEEALKLVEHSFQYVSNIANSVMEPDYFISSLFDELIDIHIAACKKSSVDPGTIAQLVGTMEDEDEYGVFLDLRERYAEVILSGPVKE